jgi:hypothetical protein
VDRTGGEATKRVLREYTWIHSCIHDDGMYASECTRSTRVRVSMMYGSIQAHDATVYIHSVFMYVYEDIYV